MCHNAYWRTCYGTMRLGTWLADDPGPLSPGFQASFAGSAEILTELRTAVACEQMLSPTRPALDSSSLRPERAIVPGFRCTPPPLPRNNTASVLIALTVPARFGVHSAGYGPRLHSPAQSRSDGGQISAHAPERCHPSPSSSHSLAPLEPRGLEPDSRFPTATLFVQRVVSVPNTAPVMRPFTHSFGSRNATFSVILDIARAWLRTGGSKR